MEMTAATMTDTEKIRTLSRGLLAAMRWLYQGDTQEHFIDPETARDEHLDPSYLADVHEAHSAYLIAKEVCKL